MWQRTVRNSLLLMLIVLAVILVPFFFFHEYIDSWTAGLLKTSGRHPAYIGLLLCILLASDILLPVPSSIVSTGAGFLLGFFYGTIISFTGMLLGCLIGYALGKSSGKAMRWLDEETKVRMGRFFQRSGKWAIIIARPIPVLAEATVFLPVSVK
ncbi:MAG: VTT domain-containing protein [Bacteroidetes bacterium]|nr:VTT domain-containing protein [Bacteroidota bacterium]